MTVTGMFGTGCKPFVKLAPGRLMLMLVLTGLAASGCDRHPSDDRLLSSFAEHRAALEGIVGLFAENHALSRVSLDDSDLTGDDDDSPMAQRVRAQLEQLDLSLVTRDPASGGVFFALHQVGIGISGASKGLLYAERLPPGYAGKLVDNIDLAFAKARAVQKNHESLDVTLLRPIEGPWYLYFETY